MAAITGLSGLSALSGIINTGGTTSFLFTVNTANTEAGSSPADTMLVATRSGETYDYTINWGDGFEESINVDTPPSRTYASGGTYQISITGDFPSLHINNAAANDKLKWVLSIDSWGEGTWTNLEGAFYGCANLASIAGNLITTSASFVNTWHNCSSLTSFPPIDTSAGVNFSNTWFNCSSLTSFPPINTSAGTNFNNAWYNCSSLTSFPLIDTSAGVSFSSTWNRCSSLTSFPLIDTSAGVNFASTWNRCSSLTSFPLIDTSAATSFASAWRDCSSLTSFPLIDTSAGANFSNTWRNCSSLTDFPPIDTSAGTNFDRAWENCALTEQSVDNIMASLIATGAIGLTTSIAGGTSAPPLQADLDVLVTARGWTIAYNGSPRT